MNALELLIPGIRKEMFRYGSMKEVYFAPDRFGRSMDVTYVLITGESRTITLPVTLFMDDKYDEIMERLTRHLGRLP